MGSLTALLNLTQGALEANQAAIDITSNNVANQNTVGYTRQVASWQERDTVSLSGGQSTSDGVTVSSASQRDRVLEQRVQQQTQAQASSSAESAALNQLQSIFGISATSSSASATAIGSAIDGFFNSLSALQAAPGDSSVREGVLSAAQTLAASFNSAANQIGQQQTGMNQQVSSIVSQVNGLTAAIAALNVQIQSSSPNQDAGGLEDQRQQDLTQLSQYVGFNQTKTENNGLTLTTTGGSPLVSEGQSFPLETAVVNGNVNVFASPGTGGQDITAGLQGGQLGGVLAVRSQLAWPYEPQLNGLAYSIGTAVNTQNEAGLDANGAAGGAIFVLPPNAGGAAGQIWVSMTDPNEIAAAGTGEGSSGGTNAAALSGLQASGMMNGQTPSEYFASYLTRVGSAASNSTSESAVDTASLTQLTTQRNALSGVSLDEEAANLTEYQRSYEAAAKVFSIVDELLASALNLGEQTTVS